MPLSLKLRTPDPKLISLIPSQRISYIQFKLMKSNKEASSIVANIVEMVLQTRISPSPQQLHRIETVRSEIEVLRSHTAPSDEVLYFLIDRQYYQIKNKMTACQRRNSFAPLSIHLLFTLFDKDTSLTETAQIWKIQLIRKQVNSLRPPHCVKQLINLVREVTNQLTAPTNFTNITRNKEANKKYVVDFKVDVCAAASNREKNFQKEFRLRQYRGRLNENYELSVSCYWREDVSFTPFLISTNAGTKTRKASQQTRGDSGSIGSQKDMSMKKYRSIDEQQQAFQFYDSELDVTILSSDSDSLSHSRKVIQELTIGEVDEFQLLIEENTDDDEIFLMENEINFENWQKLLLLSFH